MDATRTMTRSPVQVASAAVGLAFLAVGVLGFVPGVTQHYGDMEFAGHDSGAELLGIFEVSVLHNVVHLLFGVVGLWAARAISVSRGFLIGGGALYLGLWIYGLAVDKASDANFVPMNEADDWLHFALGAAMVLLGVVLMGRRTASLRPGRPMRAQPSN